MESRKRKAMSSRLIEKFGGAVDVYADREFLPASSKA